MLLINNLHGEYNSETAEGRGANAASNLIKYVLKGKKLAEQNAYKLVKGEINVEEACRNSALESLSQAYIPYTEINEETGEINLEYGMAFATIYINSLDVDGDGAIDVEECGPAGYIVDQVDPSGKITRGKFLAWLIFQDCIDVYNGIITPQEALKAQMWAINDPVFVIQKLREIYYKLGLKEKEASFMAPVPIEN